MRKLKKYFKNRFSRRKGKRKKPKVDLKVDENSQIFARKAEVEDKQIAPKETDPEGPMKGIISQEKRRGIINEMRASRGGRTDTNSDVFTEDDIGMGQALKLNELNKALSLCQLYELPKYNVQTTTENQGAMETKAKDYFQSRDSQNIHDFCNLGKYREICDLEIHIDNEVFLTNLHSVSCFSAYFSDVFSKKTKHEERNTYKMTGVSSEAFLVFLEYVYNREFNVNIRNLADVIQMAHGLRIPTLKERCLEEAVKSLLRNQCSPSSLLFHFLVSQLAKEFPLAKNIDGFYELDVSIICQILSSDYLQTTSEMAVFKVALGWINHGIPNRDQYLGRVMRNIRFPCMTQMELRECCEITNILKEYSDLLEKECSEIRENILNADWVITAKSLGVDDPLHTPIPAARKCYTEKQKDEKISSVVITEQSSFLETNQQRFLRSVECYDVTDMMSWTMP